MIQAIEWYFGLILIAAAVLIGLAAHTALGAAGLVGMLEMRYGAPGSTRVLPECGCTVRYVGTRIDGADYFVHFKKLD